MGGAHNQHAVCAGFVRLDDTNNDVVIDVGAGDVTISLATGVHWLGLNAGEAGNKDETIFNGAESILTNWSVLTGIEARLQYLDQPNAGVPDAATGHVFMQSADTDVIKWGDPATTLDPKWFGVMPEDGDFNDHVFSGATFEDVSQASSILGFVGSVQIWNDRLIERAVKKTSKADSGKVYTAFFNKHGLRLLRFRNSGIPRTDQDLPFHSMRRFVDQVNRGLGFLFFPDTGLVTLVTWDPDDQTSDVRSGYQRFTFEHGEVVDWDDLPLTEDFHVHWTKEFLCAEFIV